MNDGVLVSRAWLEKVNAALFGSSELPKGTTTDSRSLFYDVRLVSVRSGWTFHAESGSYGYWTSTGAFIVNSTVQTGFTFPLYSLSSYGSSQQPSINTYSRVWAIWRGRWEILENYRRTPLYKGSSFIAVNLEDGVGPDYIINNSGLTQAIVKETNGDANPLNGELWFDGNYFHGASIGDSTKRGVTLRVYTKRVVTNVTMTNGELVVTYDPLPFVGNAPLGS